MSTGSAVGLTPPLADAGEPLPVVGADCTFEGLLSFRGSVRVDGMLSGEVVAEGLLLVGPSAQVKANVSVDELVVSGLVEGDVQARRRVEIRPTGRVIGRVRTPRLAVADGGLLRGRCDTAPVAAATSGEASGAPPQAPGPAPGSG